ncbi:MAG: hypothetical protein AAFV43_04715 [Planctomycetota bacterium]
MPLINRPSGTAATTGARAAALRLAAIGGFALFTLAAMAMVGLRLGDRLDRAAAPMPSPTVVRVSAPAEQAEETSAVLGPSMAAPMSAAADEATTSRAAGRTADAGDWIEPLVIDNPAAFAPPADDSIPAPPTLRARSEPAPAARPSVPPARIAMLSPGVLADTPSAPVAHTPVGNPLPPARVALAAPTPITAEPMLSAIDRASFTASTTDLSQRLTPMVRDGFKLGRAGAMYAARHQFVAVLRRIGAAKDAAEGSDRYARALAAGLRALDEADDFAPRGDALEAELEVRAIAASHNTPVVRDASADVTAHEAVAIYSRYAADKLGEAAGNEPAGSMALYGLGKTYARVDAQTDDPHAGRKCLVMHRAALAAHASNHLAANELGVRLAMAGRYEQARVALHAAARQPGAAATVYDNLARVEQRLGGASAAQQAATAARSVARAESATGEVSRRHGVQWVSPAQFGGHAPALAPPPSAQATAVPQTATPQAPGPATQAVGNPFTRAFRYVKTRTGWSDSTTNPSPPPPAYQPPPIAARPTETVLR